MGHKASSKMNGGQGTLAQRRQTRTLEKGFDVVDAQMALALKSVRDAALEVSEEAVGILIGIARHSGEDTVRVAAAREVLKLAGAYPGSGRGAALSPSDTGRGLIVQVLNLTTAEAPITLEMQPLPAQNQLAKAPEPEPLDPEPEAPVA